MGRFCRLCGRIRPNEQFSGKGHRVCICKKCAGKPKEWREKALAEEEVFGFMDQSHISDRNLERLRLLAASSNAHIAKLAAPFLEVTDGLLTSKKKKKRRSIPFTSSMRKEVERRWVQAAVLPEAPEEPGEQDGQEPPELYDPDEENTPF